MSSPSPPTPRSLLESTYDPARAISLYLGIEFGLDKVQGVLVDPDLTVVNCVEVILDDLGVSPPTMDGLWHEAEGSARQPLQVVMAGLDALLETLSEKVDLKRVVKIGGCAHSAVVLLNSSFLPDLQSIPSSSTYHQYFSRSSAFTLSAVTTSLDTTTSSQFSALSQVAAQREVVLPSPLSLRSGAVQLLRLPWRKAAHVVSLNGLLESLLVGGLVEWEASSASEVTGLWDVQEGKWDEVALDLVGGGEGKGEELRRRLGEGGSLVGDGGRSVSEFVCERFGFGPGCEVVPFVPQTLAAYLSLCPSTQDVVLDFSRVDTLTFPLPHDPPPSSLYQTLPHPAQRSSDVKRSLGQIASCNGHVSRDQIKASYANSSWPVFSQMVNPVVPLGGSLGYDDKLFSFVWPLKDVHPYGLAEGTTRFEKGVPTFEFQDLRANPRCLVESQLLSLRSRLSTVLTSITEGRPTLGSPPRLALGLGFEPWDADSLPRRVLVTSSPLQESPAIMGVLADVFGSNVLKDRTQHLGMIEESPSSGALGAANLARWEPGLSASQTFEEFTLSTLNAHSPTNTSSRSTSRPPLRPRPSRSSLSSGNHSPLTLSAILEFGGERAANHLHRSKSSGLLTSKEKVGTHTDETLTLLASPDKDAFNSYCSMLPEFLRLEELFVKGLTGDLSEPRPSAVDPTGR